MLPSMHCRASKAYGASELAILPRAVKPMGSLTRKMGPVGTRARKPESTAAAAAHPRTRAPSVPASHGAQEPDGEFLDDEQMKSATPHQSLCTSICGVCAAWVEWADTSTVKDAIARPRPQSGPGRIVLRARVELKLLRDHCARSRHARGDEPGNSSDAHATPPSLCPRSCPHFVRRTPTW